MQAINFRFKNAASVLTECDIVYVFKIDRHILMKNACPCYSGKAYTACCQPLHNGQVAPDAERLMRARYSAYALRLPEFIVASWHPETRPDSLSLEDLNGIKWLKLQVVFYQQTDETHAEVKFVASYQAGKQKKTHLSEHSLFVREAGSWFYHGQLAEAE
jgi:SEC-C motif domain protein